MLLCRIVGTTSQRMLSFFVYMFGNFLPSGSCSASASSIRIRIQESAIRINADLDPHRRCMYIVCIYVQKYKSTRVEESCVVTLIILKDEKRCVEVWKIKPQCYTKYVPVLEKFQFQWIFTDASLNIHWNWNIYNILSISAPLTLNLTRERKKKSFVLRKGVFFCVKFLLSLATITIHVM